MIQQYKHRIIQFYLCKFHHLRPTIYIFVPWKFIFTLLMFTFFAVQFFRFTFVSASDGHTLPFAIAQPESIAQQKSARIQQGEAGTRHSHPPQRGWPKKMSVGRTTETGRKFGSTDRRQKGVRRPHHRNRQKIRQHRPTAKRCPSTTPPRPAENSARTGRPQKGVRHPHPIHHHSPHHQPHITSK